MLKAGVSLREITPPQGLELAGYPHYPRYNTGAHDPLYAACLVLKNEEKAVAMVTLDLLFFSKKHTAAIRKKVAASIGLPAECIMISCSHTHSGPWAAGRLDIESLEAGKKQPAAYVAFLIETISDMIVCAYQNSFEAEFSVTTAICGAEQGIGGNRRIPGGPHDPLVSVMAVREKESGTVRGIFCNYTLHPTFIHEWSNVCTADYPGYMRLEIGEAYPEAVFGFSQGASGNQSSRYYRKGESFDEAERVGRTLGRAALAALKKAVWQKELELEAVSDTVTITQRDFGTEEELRTKVARDEAVYKDLYARYGQSENREEYYLWQNANLKLLGSEDQLGYVLLAKKNIPLELYVDEDPMEVQLFRLGGCLVIGVQGEFFVEYALYLKAMAGFGTVIFNELTNGCLPGYNYTPESLVTGGYETDTSTLSEDFGGKVVAKALELAKGLKR